MSDTPRTDAFFRDLENFPLRKRESVEISAGVFMRTLERELETANQDITKLVNRNDAEIAERDKLRAQLKSAQHKAAAMRRALEMAEESYELAQIAEKDNPTLQAIRAALSPARN